jgi:hypothetical protein
VIAFPTTMTHSEIEIAGPDFIVRNCEDISARIGANGVLQLELPCGSSTYSR